MSCGGSHLGFPIGIKNSNFVKDIPMIIHVQFRFSQFISFREDLWNFSQSEHIIGLGSHIEYPTGTKNSNFVEDHPRNNPAKFGSNRPSGFGEEAWNVKSLQTTDNGRRTPSDGNSSPGPRSRWTKKVYRGNFLINFAENFAHKLWMCYNIHIIVCLTVFNFLEDIIIVVCHWLCNKIAQIIYASFINMLKFNNCKPNNL
jgi:hypothetical protein